MLGHDMTRNGVSLEENPPVDWDVGKFDRKTGKYSGSRNVKWTARLGSQSISAPVVADGLVWVGTNNDGQSGLDKKEDASLLMCFRESDGKCLYQYVSPRLKPVRSRDEYRAPLGCSPLVEGSRIWFATNRCETVFLEIGPLKRGEGEPKVAWKVDMIEALGAEPIATVMGPHRTCSIASYKDWIYVVTGNGAKRDGQVAAPKAPSLVCFNKHNGRVVWTDNSPGANPLHGQWASPLVIDIGDCPQVIAPQGDGWLRSFEAATGKLIWKFDMNPKTAKWHVSWRGKRNTILATPVYFDGLVYLAAGQGFEEGEAPGRLCCINPTKKGDISSQLVVNADGKPIPHRRLQAVDTTKGEKAVANPNSDLVWEFTQRDENRDGKIEFGEEFSRTMTNVAIKNNLVIATDISGLVHCLDAKSGQRYWYYDTLADIEGSPLIVDKEVYVADGDGDIAIFNFSADPKQAMKEINGELEPINAKPGGKYADVTNVNYSVYASPIFANGTLYIPSRSHLFAIQADGNETARGEKKPDSSRKSGFWPQWRGPIRDNVSTETGLLKKWPKDGPPLLWRVEGLGEGIASVSIAGGRVVTLGYRNELEYVTAVSAETGKQLWMTAIGRAVAENRLMRWLGQRTPTLDEDRVYAVRSDGDLVCLHLENGRELWRKSYTKDFGAARPGWGICDYPLVDGEKLICSPAGREATMVALHKKNGELIWKTNIRDGGRSSYAAAVVTEGGGLRQYVTYLRKGLVGVAAKDGRVLWRYEKPAASFANSVTPIVRGDAIVVYNGYSTGRALLKLAADGDGVKLQEQYFHAGFLDPFQDSTLWIGDYVHTFRRGGILERYDARTGERTTLVKRIGRGISSMTYADGHLFLRDSSGVVQLIEATADDYVEKARFTIPDHEYAMGASNPVIAGGRLWLRDDDRLFCYDIRENALDRRTLPALTTLRPSKSKDASEWSTRQPRSVFVPTPQDVVERMLELTNIKKSDVVYDLGSGDGRIVITAAKKYGAHSVGYEIDKELVELSRENAAKAKVENLVTIHHQDLFKADFTEADVVAVYLLPKQLEALIPQLKKLKPGSRIVSHQFAVPGIEPDKVIEIESKEDGAVHKIFLWTTPIQKPKNP